MAGHLVQATAAAEVEIRGLAGRARESSVRAFADDLVDYAAGALVAPRRAVASALIKVERATRRRS
jgi:hypothetical protein